MNSSRATGDARRASRRRPRRVGGASARRSPRCAGPPGSSGSCQARSARSRGRCDQQGGASNSGGGSEKSWIRRRPVGRSVLCGKAVGRHERSGSCLSTRYLRMLCDLIFARNVDRVGQIGGRLGSEHAPQRREQHPAVGVPLTISEIGSTLRQVFQRVGRQPPQRARGLAAADRPANLATEHSS